MFLCKIMKSFRFYPMEIDLNVSTMYLRKCKDCLMFSYKIDLNRNQIMGSCWENDPAQRPTFENLILQFRNILEESTESYGYIQ